MASIIDVLLIDNAGEPQPAKVTITNNEIDPHQLVKLCKFIKIDNVEFEHIPIENTNYTVVLFGKKSGKKKNKYAFLFPRTNKQTFYGCFIMLLMNTDTQEYINFTSQILDSFVPITEAPKPVIPTKGTKKQPIELQFMQIETGQEQPTEPIDDKPEYVQFETMVQNIVELTEDTYLSPEDAYITFLRENFRNNTTSTA